MTSVGITPTQGFVIKYLSDTLKKMKSHYPIVYVKMYCLIMRSTSWIFNHQRQRKLEMIVFKGSASKAADASQNCFPSPAVSPVLKKKTVCFRRRVLAAVHVWKGQSEVELMWWQACSTKELPMKQVKLVQSPQSILIYEDTFGNEVSFWILSPWFVAPFYGHSWLSVQCVWSSPSITRSTKFSSVCGCFCTSVFVWFLILSCDDGLLPLLSCTGYGPTEQWPLLF